MPGRLPVDGHCPAKSQNTDNYRLGPWESEKL
ncbi:hypothetical protein SEA_COLT_193 [Mycobacterium phage Colt]|uniref:Uncharacterized protein n=1 Tax=Mycobacterium phage Cane17 TaxID=2301548 RepID=A0A346N8Z0_9CAUD|nr:hypothetical protein KHO59_gp133 [Mycobacterium phage Cane17]AXQ51775.1 hypothetical protein SEA_CANE17_193 [Mycobacterium phage Cane17]QAY14109.1 hypothetical protein SEA_COLT_193 [Mycobacterium phage Colt]